MRKTQAVSKESVPQKQEPEVDSWVRKIPGQGAWQAIVHGTARVGRT